MTYTQFSPALAPMLDVWKDIWCDADMRRALLQDLLIKQSQGDVATYRQRVAQIDLAVESALRHVALPRGPVARVDVVAMPPQMTGQKRPTCVLELSQWFILGHLRSGTSEAVLETWVHESLHARQPFSRGFAREYIDYPGYEEGVVEGLTKIVCEDHAGNPYIGGAYESYVTTYRALASVLQVEVEAVFRALWVHPAGKIRERFVGTLGQLRGASLDRMHESLVLTVADVLFAVTPPVGLTAVDDIARLWEVALR